MGLLLLWWLYLWTIKIIVLFYVLTIKQHSMIVLCIIVYSSSICFNKINNFSRRRKTEQQKKKKTIQNKNKWKSRIIHRIMVFPSSSSSWEQMKNTAHTHFYPYRRCILITTGWCWWWWWSSAIFFSHRSRTSFLLFFYTKLYWRRSLQIIIFTYFNFPALFDRLIEFRFSTKIIENREPKTNKNSAHN